jgi:beta-glucanase (GH16 family)
MRQVGARARWCIQYRVPFSAAIVAVVVVGACLFQVQFPRGEAAPDPAAVVFADEFDGPAGSFPDRGEWTPDVGGTGWGNDELQFYTYSGNVFLDGAGNLVIEARRATQPLKCWYGTCEYTSGKVTTKRGFAQRYGTFEARVKSAVGTGLWGAFWLLGNDIEEVGFPESGEIDVLETLGHRPRDVEQHVQGPGLRWGSEHVLPDGESVGDWHTYAVRWAPDRIEWYVDGGLTRTLTKEEAGDSWVFDHPFYMLLNLAVGGEWPGSPDDETEFPSRMLIDYVRVYA